ncbi:unnamed protein product [Nyctereutes procyonoides]|uniref:Protein FAM162A n=1 Tax=Nyctereutes procyonoides TaxID=34880 RepID=A0A811Y117_NYCPR|nr:unnamed protein product [Nyctereutes procyonoides]
MRLSNLRSRRKKSMKKMNRGIPGWLSERDVSSSLRFTRNSDVKAINGFCPKPQEMPLHKPMHWKRKILTWSGGFKKEDEGRLGGSVTVLYEVLDGAKNKIWGKISKRAIKRNESLTSLNLEKKAA